MINELIFEGAVCFFSCLGIMWVLRELSYIIMKPRLKKMVVIIDPDGQDPLVSASYVKRMLRGTGCFDAARIIAIGDDDQTGDFIPDMSVVTRAELAGAIDEKM